MHGLPEAWSASISMEADRGYCPKTVTAIFMPFRTPRPDCSDKAFLGIPDGDGTLIAFSAHSHELVDQFHALGMALGATNEGTPVLRSQYHDYFYGAYLRDPDGNKPCCVCHDHFKSCP